MLRGKQNKQKIIRLFEYGARNNKPDSKRIQEMHDLACELGAECQAMGDMNKPMMETKRQRLAKYFKHQVEAVSYDATRDKIREKLCELYPEGPNMYGPYVAEMFDTYVIVELGPPCEYWQVGYTINGEDVELSPQMSWQKVERQQSWVRATEARKRKLEALKRWATKNT